MTRDRFVLGIDTAARHGSIALVRNGAAIAWESLQPGAHSSGLSEAGERLLKQQNIEWRDLAGIAVSEGPGSFTGLRIGLAWAKGICMGSNINLVLVSAHEAAAAMHRREGELVATIMQGERGSAQGALWSGGAIPTPLWGPESIPEEDLATRLLAATKPARGPEVPIGITAPDLRPELRDQFHRAGFVMLDGEKPAPAAMAVAELGDRKLLAGEAVDPVRAAPAYGRAPNARKPAS